MVGKRRATYYAKTRPAAKRVYPMKTARLPTNVGDHKFLDIARANYVNDQTGTITHLDVVPRNTGVNGRIGKAFKPTSVQLQGTVVCDATTVVTQFANYLVWDRNPNQALPAIDDILTSVHPGSFPKRENSHRFKIVRRFAGVLSGNNAGTTGVGPANIINVQEYVRLPPEAVALCTSSDETGVIANRIQGALYWITCGDKTAGTSDALTTMTFRLNYME